ncbi:hypothetical protein MTO96_030308, partial [Rhipicephalus appendiculatus]
MSSFNQPEITDPVVQSVISALRRAPGVHIYLDAAYKDTTKKWTYTGVIDNWEKIPSGKMTYAFLVQAHKDNPEYSIGLYVADDDSVGLRMGYTPANHLYGTVMTCEYKSVCPPNDWRWYFLTVGDHLNAGDFFVHSVDFLYPSTYPPTKNYEAQLR